MLEKIGFGDYDRGCRAGMIRDRLRALDRATEADMLAIQLDDRAVFLDRWRKLLLDVLSPEAVAQRSSPRVSSSDCWSTGKAARRSTRPAIAWSGRSGSGSSVRRSHP